MTEIDNDENVYTKELTSFSIVYTWKTGMTPRHDYSSILTYIYLDNPPTILLVYLVLL